MITKVNCNHDSKLSGLSRMPGLNNFIIMGVTKNVFFYLVSYICICKHDVSIPTTINSQNIRVNYVCTMYIVHTVYITLHSKTNICVIINNYRIFFFKLAKQFWFVKHIYSVLDIYCVTFFLGWLIFYRKTCTTLARARARAKRRKAKKKILKLITLKWLVFFL